MGSSIWQIGQNTLVEFSNSCPGLLDKTYDINGVLLQDEATRAQLFDKEERTKNKNKQVPDNLIRHQLMGLLVRVAKDKYLVRSIIYFIILDKSFTNLVEAIKYSFENHFYPVIKDFDNHKWRLQRYYNEEVDNVIKAYLPIFDGVYKSWAPRKDPRRRE